MNRSFAIIIFGSLAACADPYHGVDPVEFSNRPLITYDEREIFGAPSDIGANVQPDGTVIIAPVAAPPAQAITREL